MRMLNVLLSNTRFIEHPGFPGRTPRERTGPARPSPVTDSVTGDGEGAFQQGRMWKTGVQDAVPVPLATWDQRSLPSLL